MIPDSRPILSDLYTLSKRKLLENHTLHSGTYLYSPSGGHQMTHVWQYPPDINSKKRTKSMNSHQRKRIHQGYDPFIYVIERSKI